MRRLGTNSWAVLVKCRLLSTTCGCSRTAIQTSGDRRAALAALTVPTLVIHGADDPLVRVEGGRDTAATIPDAELHVIEGMGHDVPPGLYDVFVDAIAAHTSKAEAAA